MNEQEYCKFAQESVDRLIELNQRLEEKFNVGSYERWDFDQRTNEFVFSHDGVPRVIAKVQLVGSISSAARTWLWSWANASILETTRDQIHGVREFGVTHGITKLTEAKWEADEADGWEMAAVSAAVLGAKGAYRCPTKAGFLFVVFTDVHSAAN